MRRLSTRQVLPTVRDRHASLRALVVDTVADGVVQTSLDLH